MEYAVIIIMAVVVVSVLAVFAVKHLHNNDVKMGEDLEDYKRTNELVAEARAHFPTASKFNAVNFYLDKMQRDIILLKNHLDTDEAMDVYREMLRDRRLLLQERVHLAHIDAEINCDYNLLANI